MCFNKICDFYNFLLIFRLKIIIPNHTVAFRKKRRALGIAYAEFEDNAEAQKAIKSVNGTTFKKRIIYAKMHVPFSTTDKQSDTNQVNCDSEPVTDINDKEKVTEDAIKVSNDTVYLPNLYANTTDEEIREFFKDYQPKQIYIFKEKTPKRHLFGYRQTTCCLVTLEVDKPLTTIITELKKKKLKNYRVSIKPAYISKIEKVIAADKKRANEENETPMVSPEVPEVHDIENNVTQADGQI